MSSSDPSALSSIGSNTGGFTTGLEGATSQMPSTLGGVDGSFSNLTGTGTAASSGYTPGNATMFTDSGGSALNLGKLQSSLAAASKIAAPTSGQQQQGARTGGMRSPGAQTFSSGINGTPLVNGSNGAASLLALMQQLKG